MSAPQSIHEAVKRDLDARAARGLREYGVPLTRDTPGLPRHLYEELLDAACYLRAAMEAQNELARLRAGLEALLSPCGAPDCIHGFRGGVAPVTSCRCYGERSHMKKLPALVAALRALLDGGDDAD